MRSKLIFMTCFVLLLTVTAFLITELVYARTGDSSDDQNTQAASASSERMAQLQGTWSGSFQPSGSDRSVPAFSITVEISPDAGGRLVGVASLDSDCLKEAKLQVAIENSKVVLAGGDARGNNITIRGTIDDSGTLLKVKYILNGSATGVCELDSGVGTLAKR
jgi:hypothetical protein